MPPIIERGGEVDRMFRPFALATLLVLAGLGALVYGDQAYGRPGALVAAAVLAVLIGFGLLGLIRDFFAGLVLAVTRPFRIGDLIAALGVEGTVRRIGVRASELESADGARVIIPNTRLLAARITNRTRLGTAGQIAIPLQVSRQSAPDRVRALLMAVAAEHPSVLASPPPEALFEGFAAGNLLFSLRVHVRDIAAAQTVRSELHTRLYQSLETHRIEIPYPQSDLHLRDLDAVKKALAKVMAERARDL